MASITHKGALVHTSGELPKVGAAAPDFLLTKVDLADVSLKDFAGKRKILSVNPSLDTGICAASLRRFNQEADKLGGVVVLNVSRDTPFAAKRFCETEGIKNALAVSEFRNRDFGRAYGIAITDGKLAGALGRAVVVIDDRDRVVYTELVPEIAQEPDYAAALAAVQTP